jgi:hypothetical protein
VQHHPDEHDIYYGPLGGLAGVDFSMRIKENHYHLFVS